MSAFDKKEKPILSRPESSDEIRKDVRDYLVEFEMTRSQIRSGKIECPHKKHELIHIRNGFHRDCGYFSCEQCGKWHHNYMKK